MEAVSALQWLSMVACQTNPCPFSSSYYSILVILMMMMMVMVVLVVVVVVVGCAVFWPRDHRWWAEGWWWWWEWRWDSFQKTKTFYRVLTGFFTGIAILVSAAFTLHKNYIIPQIHFSHIVWGFLENCTNLRWLGADTSKEEMSTQNIRYYAGNLGKCVSSFHNIESLFFWGVSFHKDWENSSDYNLSVKVCVKTWTLLYF